MKIGTWFIHLHMHHVPVQPMPDELAAEFKDSLTEMSAPMLCWMLQTVAEELKTRGIEVSDHGN